MDKRIINKITQYIQLIKKNNIRIEKIFLFGSYAKNKQFEESDIDLALIFEDLDDSNKFDMQVQLMLLASQIDSRIEPHPLSIQDFEANNPFAVEIKRTGLEIYPDKTTIAQS